MIEIKVLVALVFVVVLVSVAISVAVARKRSAHADPTEIAQRFDATVRTEAATSRAELATELSRAREENQRVIAVLHSALDDRARRTDDALTVSLERVRHDSEERMALLRRDLLERQDQIRGEAEANRRVLREEISTTLSTTTKNLLSAVSDFSTVQRGQMETFGKQIDGLIEGNDRRFESLQHSVQHRLVEIETRTNDTLEKTRVGVEQKLDTSAQEMLARHERMRDEAASNRKQQRDEITLSLTRNSESLQKCVERMGAGQAGQMEAFGVQINSLVTGNDQRFDSLRVAIDGRLSEIRDRNAEQLEQMRATVDEKLQGTLEKRLGESFKQVSDHLEQVHRGLGEMQSLATGVGDLKRVLTNVKSRGGWGEVQLEALLEQMLTPDQYAKNVRVKADTSQSVEFAIALPARGDSDEITYLPIDAKFPMEDYQRLCDAQERGDLAAVELAGVALEQAIRKSAKDICDKYINPPVTTDFAILFLPNEGLFAEVIRRTGLMEKLQRDCRVTIAGPTTFSAILNSLQMGFRTLAIEKRSSEVWNVLGAVKTEFGKFADVLDGVKRKLDSATKTVDEAGRRTRAIERKLRDVESLPEQDAVVLLTDIAEIDEQSVT